MGEPPEWNWKNPDYAGIFEQRTEALLRIREHPECLPDLKAYYRSNPADFISDWGITYEPRNIERGLPAVIPFLLFERQREWVNWVIERWRNQESGATEKSRDCGVTWEAIALACTLCIFYESIAIGFGSRKSEYVDHVGTMKPILPKGRMFMEHLPEEFRAGWMPWNAPLMRLNFPETGSIIAGEGGDQIGRGDRVSIFFVDEAEHLEHPLLVEAALSQTTNCRIDISSVNGSANPIAQKILQQRVKVFVFDWRSDPRKDEEWYAKQCADLDPVVVAQEIDRDRSASVSGIVLPGAWLRSCVGACEKLGLTPTGAPRAALDVADEGVDNNAVGGATGVQIDFLEEWSGKGSDLFDTANRAVAICDLKGYPGYRYDADGLGAGIRGDMRVINEQRVALKARPCTIEGFRGSEAVFDPDGIVEGTQAIDRADKGRTNKDYFANRKAQGWWALRRRAQRTHRWITEGIACDPDEILSIDPKMPLCWKLVSELSQPTYQTNGVGKIVIDKKPEGMPSPNLGDTAMMLFAPNEKAPMVISQELLRRAAAMPRRRQH